MIELNLEGLGSLKKKFTRVYLHPASDFAPCLPGLRFQRFYELLKRVGNVDEVDPIFAVRVPEADGHVNGSVAVVSGRSKLEAFRRMGKEPRIEIYDGPLSPADLAATLNLFHNHPTTGQLAAIGVEYQDLIKAEARKRMQSAGGDRKSATYQKTAETAIGASESLSTNLSKAIFGSKIQTDDDAESIDSRRIVAETLDISEGYLSQALRIREHDSDLFERMKRREYTLAQAFSQVRQADKKKNTRNAYIGLGELARKKIDAGIVNGDSLKIMPTLKRSAFRLIFADPPYNIGIDYGNGSKADQLPDAHYLAWCERWMKQLPDLLTPDGSAWTVIDQKYLGEYLVMMKRTGLKMRSLITWYETFGANCTDKFNRTSRHLLYFVKSEKRLVFKPECFARPSDRITKYNDPRANPNGKLWDDVWVGIPRLVSGEERMPGFPTQLPLGLVLPIIDGCSDEGDNILDPFGGTGTTAAASALSRRNCMSIEINPEYASVSRERVAKALAAQGGKR
jgi:DNA modification methylase